MAESGAPHSGQVDAVVRGARRRLRSLQERAHILAAVLQAIERYDAVIAVIRSSDSSDAAKQRLTELLDIDELQARAVMDIQGKALLQQHHQQMIDEYDGNVSTIADLESTLASPERMRELVGTERGRYLAKYGNG